MTKIKLCGLKRPCDIEYANTLAPEYIGFVFAKKSKRYVSPEEAEGLRQQLNKGITPVGVFVDADFQFILELLKQHIIEAIQLHGNEDETYIADLREALRREHMESSIIKAFLIKDWKDITAANQSSADYVLLDSGGGSGEVFDWSLLKKIKRPYFLAGGISPENVQSAIGKLQPFGVDASSSLETQGYKDKEKMTAFVKAVRERKD